MEINPLHLALMTVINEIVTRSVTRDIIRNIFIPRVRMGYESVAHEAGDRRAIDS